MVVIVLMGICSLGAIYNGLNLVDLYSYYLTVFMVIMNIFLICIYNGLNVVFVYSQVLCGGFGYGEHMFFWTYFGLRHLSIYGIDHKPYV